MTDKEEAFRQEVSALARYEAQELPADYVGLAAYFREIARRAMICAYRAEEAAQEVATARPALEPE